MSLFHAWVEEIETKRIIDAYVGNSFISSHDLVDKYGHKPEYEVFFHDGLENICYWWKGSTNKWVKCNWDCSIPENLGMRILVGAL